MEKVKLPHGEVKTRHHVLEPYRVDGIQIRNEVRKTISIIFISYKVLYSCLWIKHLKNYK